MSQEQLSAIAMEWLLVKQRLRFQSIPVEDVLKDFYHKVGVVLQLEG